MNKFEFWLKYYNKRPNNRGKKSTYEAFPSLIRWEINKLRFAKVFSKNISENVIRNNQQTGQNEPNQTFIQIKDSHQSLTVNKQER